MKFASIGLLITLLASPAVAHEEGWLFTSIMEAIETREAARLEDQFNIALVNTSSWGEIEASELISMLTGCRLDYAQDSVLYNGPGVRTGTNLGYRCEGTSKSRTANEDCYDPGFSLAVSASNEERRTLRVSEQAFWSTERCGRKAMPAPLQVGVTNGEEKE